MLMPSFIYSYFSNKKKSMNEPFHTVIFYFEEAGYALLRMHEKDYYGERRDCGLLSKHRRKCKLSAVRRSCWFDEIK